MSEAPKEEEGRELRLRLLDRARADLSSSVPILWGRHRATQEAVLARAEAYLAFVERSET